MRWALDFLIQRQVGVGAGTALSYHLGQELIPTGDCFSFLEQLQRTSAESGGLP
jgi:hypothetical protein